MKYIVFMDINLDDSVIVKRIFEVTSERTLTGVAKSLGMNKSAPSNWRNSGKIPNDVLVRIGIQYNCSIDYLCFGHCKIEDMSAFENAFGDALTSLVAAECIDVTEKYNPATVREVVESMVEQLENKIKIDKLDLLRRV